MASQLAVLNLSGSSGSKNQEDSPLDRHRSDAEFGHLSNHNQGSFQILEGLQKRKERVFKQTSGSKREDNTVPHSFAGEAERPSFADSKVQSTFMMNLDFLDDNAEVIVQ